MSDRARMESWRTVLVGLCASHGQRYLRAAVSIVRDQSDAEDACQQAFLKAWQNGLQAGIPTSPQAWLMRLTINEAVTLYRRRRAAANLGLRAAAARMGDTEDEPPGNESDTRVRLVAALDSLPESTRAVLVLRVIEGFSGNETAELLACNAAEVSRRLQSGMEALRRVLSGGLGEPGASSKRVLTS